MENTKMLGYLFENQGIKSQAEGEEFRNILISSLQEGSYLDLYGDVSSHLLGSIDKESYQRAINKGLTFSNKFVIEPIEMYFFKHVDDEDSQFYKEFAYKERYYGSKDEIEIMPMYFSVKEFLNQEY